MSAALDSALFAALQRPLALYARALIARDPPLRAAGTGVSRTFANEFGWFFPPRYAMFGDALGRRAYFAAAAHLAAHARFGAPPAARAGLRPIQIVLTSLFEDARVEALWLRELPGLARVWGEFHTAAATDLVTFPGLCARLARALFDPSFHDPHPLVGKARALFFARDGALPSPERCRELGSLLGNDVGQSRLPFNAKEYAVEPPYRDDHRLQWQEQADPERPPWLEEVERVAPQNARAGPPPPAAAPAAAQNLELSPGAGATAPRYPEWDYLIRRERPGFATVLDRTAESSRASIPRDPALQRHLGRLSNRLRARSLGRVRGQLEGDSIDLDAAIAAVVDLRARRTPHARVYVRQRALRRRVAVLVLLDVSKSTGERAPHAASTVLELERAACLLLGDVLARTGDAFAVHGFSSNGRHAVEYLRIKDLAEPWDDARVARLAALAPRQSTRMGAALRHAGAYLGAAREEQRWVLLLTDGEPADVDVPDPLYLLHDARQAVLRLRRQRLRVFAISLDRGADRYVTRIFGRGQYVVLERADALPALLPRLYARIAG